MVTIAFRLLEGVINGQWESWVSLLGKLVHCSCHALKEKSFCFAFVAVAMRRSNQFLSFGHSQCAKKLWETYLRRTAQPDIEKIR